MCHACHFGYRKYLHELPDTKSLLVKTDDLINGRYEWDPEYLHASNSGGGIIFSEEEEKEFELRRRIDEVLSKTAFAHSYKNIIDGIRQKSDSRL
jgi:hypothetical protein